MQQRILKTKEDVQQLLTEVTMDHEEDFDPGPLPSLVIYEMAETNGWPDLLYTTFSVDELERTIERMKE